VTSRSATSRAGRGRGAGFVLNQRGIDSTKEFIERQTKFMEDGG
jgi:hypothetical protein